MSQCPICNAAIWKGQRYCSTCDSYLPNPGDEDYFCPKCGIRVAPQQEICHKCNTSLPEMAGASLQTLTRARRSSLWVIGIFIGTGLAIVVLLLVFLFNKGPGPVPPPAPAASGQTSATSSLKAETAPAAPTAPAPEELSGPSAPLSPREFKTPVPAAPRYLVNVRRLALRDGPTRSAPWLANLKFKDEVELLDTSDGWGKIREVQRDLIGWSNMRYLVPVTTDQP